MLKEKLNGEIASGRLAMMAITCMLFQDGFTGSAWVDWALCTVSPLRAIENELGVQAPVGFFDLAGFAADGNAENFARRRQTEIKFGRIAMLAAIGYITPEITGKLPGYLAVRWPGVRGRAQRPRRRLQGAGRWLGSDPCLHGLLRDLARPVPGHCGCRG